MRQMVALVGDVRRVLNRLLHGVVLDLEQWLVGQTDLGGRLVAELQTHHFSARGDQPAFHGYWHSRTTRMSIAVNPLVVALMAGGVELGGTARRKSAVHLLHTSPKFLLRY